MDGRREEGKEGRMDGRREGGREGRVDGRREGGKDGRKEERKEGEREGRRERTPNERTNEGMNDTFLQDFSILLYGANGSRELYNLN